MSVRLRRLARAVAVDLDTAYANMAMEIHRVTHWPLRRRYNYEPWSHERDGWFLRRRPIA